MTHATEEVGSQQGLTDQASAKVQDAASAAQEKASELRGQGSARLRDEFDQRSNQAGSQMRSLAVALRRSGDDLANDGSTSVAPLTEQAAERIERLGSYLEQKDGDELMRDIESFARRRPWMLAGIGMLVGVAAARFMKASSEQRYDVNRRTNQQWPTPTGPTGGRASVIRRTEAGYDGDVDRSVDEPFDTPVASSDDPLARDRYAGQR